MYRSRFFIDSTFKNDCEVKKDQLEKTVQAQQKVIERMAKQLKLLEESKQNLQEEHYTLVSLFQDREDEIKQLKINEKKYKLILSQYIH
jgi:hypothetical protein